MSPLIFHSDGSVTLDEPGAGYPPAIPYGPKSKAGTAESSSAESSSPSSSSSPSRRHGSVDVSRGSRRSR